MECSPLRHVGLLSTCSEGFQKRFFTTSVPRLCGLTASHTCFPEMVQSTLSPKGIDTLFNEAENEAQSAAINHRLQRPIHHRQQTKCWDTMSDRSA